MENSSLQVCMDSSDWFQQGTMSEDMSTGLDSSSSDPSGGATECMLAAACSSRAGGGQPVMERRLRPPHDQNLNCPRCDSTNTKFCYYNNYSLTQPRYFCKTCRRYWTKGGTLRNIPVGGGCRKNKKSSSKKSSSSNNIIDHQNQPMMNHQNSSTIGSSSSGNPVDLHLCFPHDVQFPPSLVNLMSLGGTNFMESGLVRPIDYMESKYEALVGGSRGHNFMGSITNGSEFGVMSGHNGLSTTNNFSGICLSSPFGVTSNDHIHDGNSAISFMDQRLLLPYDGNDHHHHHQMSGIDVKPNPKLLSLEWQDLGCTSDVGKDSSFVGYNNVNGTLSSWSAMMGGFQPSPAI